MDKRQLQTFAVWAKNNLEEQIKVSLGLLGIKSGSDIQNAYIQGDFTIIEGDSNSYSRDLKRKRDSILQHIKTAGYDHIIEEFAYTWFNRLIALRFMEVHNYLDHGFKIFPDKDGSIEPEILSKVNLVKDDLDLETEIILKHKDSSNVEELYKYLLFKQCNKLGEILPMLFAVEMDYLELLLPSNLLRGDTILTRIVAIDEDLFLNDVNIIGWLYQYYISSKKDKVFASKEKISEETLPAVTQLFTPSWIVKYLVHNTIAATLDPQIFNKYMDESNYYIEPVKNNNSYWLNTSKLKFIDPCCGSGHILVEAFDSLYNVYIKLGFSPKDSIALILTDNLIGLDIDKRACQLASFALIMKARSKNKRFFSDTDFILPNIFEIPSSSSLIDSGYKEKLLEIRSDFKETSHYLTDLDLQHIDYAIENFKFGKTIGSLLKLNVYDYTNLHNKINFIRENALKGIFNIKFVDDSLLELREILKVAEVLTTQFDIMVTNPPYISSASFEENQKKYFFDKYKESKKDMYAMFMDTNLIKSGGLMGMINQHQWMFISSFEKFRRKIVESKTILSLLHLGSGAFDDISGEVVQSVAFIMKNEKNLDNKGKYFRLVDSKNKHSDFRKFLSKREYSSIKQKYFIDFPSNSVIYWMDDEVASLFNTNNNISKSGFCKSGIMTGDDKKFIKMWFEVERSTIAFDNKLSLYNDELKKWFSLNTGGFQKWYGNNLSVVNLEKKGYDISNSGKNHRLRDDTFYFKNGIAWSEISTGSFSARYVNDGSLFGSTAPMFFGKSEQINLTLLGILNTKLSEDILKMLNPTLHYNVGTVNSLPFCLVEDHKLIELVQLCISLCRKHWDYNELSFNFKGHPILEFEGKLLKEKTQHYINQVYADIRDLKKSELDIESLVRHHFGIQKSDHEFKSTIKSINEYEVITSFISYIVGKLFGQFEDFNDNSEGFTYLSVSSKSNDSINLLTEFLRTLKLILGLVNYQSNLCYISQIIGKRVYESDEDTIARYFESEFYKAHVATYSIKNSRLPIYWMMSSGKLGAFKCLIYMHKYNEDSLAKINSKLFLPELARIKFELEDLIKLIKNADDKEKRKLDKRKSDLQAKYTEMQEYGLVLDHMANRYISINLDDGVKVNYAKFQGIEIVTDSNRKIKKDLLVPLK